MKKNGTPLIPEESSRVYGQLLHMHLIGKAGEGSADERMLSELGIIFEQGFSLCTRERDQFHIGQVFHSDIRQPGLAGAEETAGTAEREISLSDIESALTFFERLETLIFGGGMIARNQETG